jgi:hypothetical protein
MRLEAVSELYFEPFVFEMDWTVINMTTVRRYHK